MREREIVPYGEWVSPVTTEMMTAASVRLGAVAIDGDTAFVGASAEDDGGTINNGAAYVFTRSGGVWTEHAKLLASDKAKGDSFGSSVAIDGFFGPSHVSSIIGSRPYEFFAEEYQKPVVIAGFEPLDVMQSALMLIGQLNDGRHEVENEYTRVVTRDGNLKAQRLVADVFELRREFEWRGLGEIDASLEALELAAECDELAWPARVLQRRTAREHGRVDAWITAATWVIAYTNTRSKNSSRKVALRSSVITGGAVDSVIAKQ